MDIPLDPIELEAIQAAIREAGPATLAAPSVEVTPLPLIAADREAQAARPRLADLAQRWARRLARSLRAFVGDVSVDAMGAEMLDTGALADELQTMWTGLVGPAGRGAVIIGFGGDLVAAAAARRCGDTTTQSRGREPSPLSLRLFKPVGEAGVAALIEAWSEIERVELVRPTITADEQARALGTDTVLAATLAVSGTTTGRVRIFAQPSVLMPPERRSTNVPADGAAVAAALGGVPVELRVELGTLSMTLGELRALEPGAQLELPVFVDDALPIYCGDVLKAWGRPVVNRGVLAVEIAALATPGGNRP